MSGFQRETKNNILIAAGVCAMVYLFMSRSLLLYLPVFVLVLYGLWKRGGGNVEKWEEEDPADWWKKDSQSEEQ